MQRKPRGNPNSNPTQPQGKPDGNPRYIKRKTCLGKRKETKLLLYPIEAFISRLPGLFFFCFGRQRRETESRYGPRPKRRRLILGGWRWVINGCTIRWDINADVNKKVVTSCNVARHSAYPGAPPPAYCGSGKEILVETLNNVAQHEARTPNQEVADSSRDVGVTKSLWRHGADVAQR